MAHLLSITILLSILLAQPLTLLTSLALTLTLTARLPRSSHITAAGLSEPSPPGSQAASGKQHRPQNHTLMLHNLQRQGKLVTPKPAGEGARNRHEPHVLASPEHHRAEHAMTSATAVIRPNQPRSRSRPRASVHSRRGRSATRRPRALRSPRPGPCSRRRRPGPRPRSSRLDPTQRARPMSDDPLDIPPFLRREKNPKTAPALRHATEHEWIITLALARRRRASPSPGNRRAARSARARSALRETDTAGPRTARRSAPHAKARGAVTPRGETSLTRHNNPLRASLAARASRRLRPSAWPGNHRSALRLTLALALLQT